MLKSCASRRPAARGVTVKPKTGYEFNPHSNSYFSSQGSTESYFLKKVIKFLLNISIIII